MLFLVQAPAQRRIEGHSGSSDTVSNLTPILVTQRFR